MNLYIFYVIDRRIAGQPQTAKRDKPGVTEKNLDQFNFVALISHFTHRKHSSVLMVDLSFIKDEFKPVKLSLP